MSEYLPTSTATQVNNLSPTTQSSNTFSVSGVRDVKLVPGSSNTTESSKSVVSEYTEPVLYIRSRNIEFDSTGLKPVTRFYPFFSETDISNYVIPKLLEITMISGVFQVGETVVSDATFIQNKISFRLCSLNHKTGKYSSPKTTYSTNPYTQQPLGSTYSESSTVLNVDTKSLGLPSETSFSGGVSIGMRLIGKTSGAVAEVTNIRLISDRSGRLIGSFYIPNPNQFGNVKFINGVNTFTLLDVDSLNLLGQAESFSESKYTSSAVNNITETNIITTRNVEITFPYLVTTVGETRTTIDIQARNDGGTTGGTAGEGSSRNTVSERSLQRSNEANARLAARTTVRNTGTNRGTVSTSSRGTTTTTTTRRR